MVFVLVLPCIHKYLGQQAVYFSNMSMVWSLLRAKSNICLSFYEFFGNQKEKKILKRRNQIKKERGRNWKWPKKGWTNNLNLL